MPLIKSISGIRGTLGGQIGESLTPIDVVTLVAAFGQWLMQQTNRVAVVMGSDARPSGVMIGRLVSATLQSVGLDVIDVGLSTTPTVSISVQQEQAAGGVMITASHNPLVWNGLKLFNHAGVLLDAVALAAVFSAAEHRATKHTFVAVDSVGRYTTQNKAIDQHIARILALPLVDVSAIRHRQFKIAVDAVHSTGGLAVPALLRALGSNSMTVLYGEPHGQFPHNPEPLPAHLQALIETIRAGDYDFGIAVDPDVDRLMIIDERGIPWGEEYTLVGVMDYVLRHTPGNTVVNLSTSQAAQTIAKRHNSDCTSVPVGEQYVVAKMQAIQAVIGGEGNGGIIYPALHYNRDALVGIALLLSHLAQTKMKASELRSCYPSYVLTKQKISFPSAIDWVHLVHNLENLYSTHPINTEDGIKIMFEKAWIQLRKSNTEPIVRIYAEAENAMRVADLVAQLMQRLEAYGAMLLD